MNFKLLLNILLAFLLVSLTSCPGEDEKYGGREALVVSYNVENLFDTVDAPSINDEEFLPNSAKKWTQDKYKNKIRNIGLVISRIASEYRAPAMIGLCEVENIGVLEDLVNSDLINEYNYGIVHYDSPDARGIDVALLYRPGEFELIDSHKYSLELTDPQSGQKFATRDQLVVKGLLLGDEVHVIVNHWPARRSSDAGNNSPFREKAAQLTRWIVDSLLQEDPNARIMMMGDFNDDPTDESIVDILRAVKTPNPAEGELFNPMAGMFESGQGSLPYNGQWNLFDQIILSPAFLNKGEGSVYYHTAAVFKREFLLQQSGDYKGYTWRTYVGNNYHGGFSDHLPVFVIFRKN